LCQKKKFQENNDFSLFVDIENRLTGDYSTEKQRIFYAPGILLCLPFAYFQQPKKFLLQPQNYFIMAGAALMPEKGGHCLPVTGIPADGMVIETVF